MFKIELGAEVKDCVTGFSGIVTGRADYVTGCRQYAVTPTTLKDDGSPVGGGWYDEDRLLKSVAELASEANDPTDPATKPGGPQSNPAPFK
jgi:hypothetical protein